MGGQVNDEAWLSNIYRFSTVRQSGKTMTEYEAKFYEAACEMMEQKARYHKLMFEQGINLAKEQIKNERTSGDSEPSSL